MIPARVMPSRMSSETGGVTRMPSRTTKMFSAEPSETWPSSERTSASSKPLSIASLLLKAGFTYEPTIFARDGIAGSDVRRQETVPIRTPTFVST